MSAPQLSIVVCTHNRASDVRECIEAVHPQLHDTSTELLIVDSASNVDNARQIRELTARYPGVNLVVMAEKGLSLARNAGVAASRSPWVAFLDDDAVPHAGWYEGIVGAISRVSSDCGAIGGRILPRFLHPPGRPLYAREKMYLSLNDRTGQRDCSEKFELIAANCCFRKVALAEVGGFPPDIGRVGTQLLSGEDVMVMRRMVKAGWRINYDDAFCVDHKISPQRVTSKWFRQRAYWEGITTMRMARILNDPSRRVLALKSLIAAPISLLLSLVEPPANERLLRGYFSLGVLAETMYYHPKEQLHQLSIVLPIHPLKTKHS